MLINIQFLRFAAAMLVVLYHSSAHLRSVGIDQGPLFALSEAIGFAGVDIFFVISGFIMAWTTTDAAGSADAWQFLRRRLARIYSGYWPFFLIAIPLFAWASPEFFKAADIGRSAFLWPANRLLVAVAWTLIFELYFYCCYALLIGFSRGRHVAVLITALAVIGAWSVYSEFTRQAYAPGNLEHISIAEYYMASPYMAEFVAGALAASWLMRRPGGGGWFYLVAGVMLFISGAWWNNQFFDSHIEQGYWVFYRVLVFGVPSVLIVFGLVRLEQSKISSPARFSLLAGGASYATYLSHTLILTLTQKLGFNDWLATFPAPIAQLAFVVLSAVILAYSVAHYRVVERPLNKLFLRLTGAWRRPAVA